MTVQHIEFYWKLKTVLFMTMENNLNLKMDKFCYLNRVM